MLSFTSPESDFSEFVEVDPTGRYGRYNEVLGKGASKIVYRGFDEYEGIEVAWNQVKLFDFLQRPEDVERLYSEIHLLKTLKHKNIMKFYTSWVDVANRNINFVTEMFTSGTLRQYRQRHKRVNIRAIKQWCKQILKGLLYLHSLDPPVIHRDLKCDNIFINGHQGEVKIGDLGLAAILHKSHAAHCVGTPEFMAPEIYKENYNELVDIYAFGMCILEMVTFEYPYSECTNAVQIYQKVMNGKKPDALYKVKDPEVRRFIVKCLATASSRLSAKELLKDSFLHIDDHEVNLRPPGKLGDMGHVQRQLLIQHSSCDRYRSVDIEINDVELFTYGEDKHSRTMDVTVKGKRKEDDEIFLRLKITDHEGLIRNIYFSFDIETDTALSVATEMVTELDITDQDVTMIAEMIDGEIAFLVPEWQAGLAIEETPRRSSATICRNCASSSGSLLDYLSSQNEGTDLQRLPCLKDGCASMHGRFEEVTYQEETELCVTDGAPVLSSQSDEVQFAELWDQNEEYELSLEGSGELNSESREQLNISDFDRNAIVASYNIKTNSRKCAENVPGHHPPPNTPTSSCLAEEEFENETRNELSWVKGMYQKESCKLNNASFGRHSRAPSWSPETSNRRNKTETPDSSPISTRMHRKSNKVLFKSFGSGKHFSCYIEPIQNNCPDSETQRGRLCEATIVSMSPEHIYAARSIYGTSVRPRVHHRTTSLLVDAVDF